MPMCYDVLPPSEFKWTYRFKPGVLLFMQNYHNAPINVSAIFPARAGDSVHANKKQSLAKER